MDKEKKEVLERVADAAGEYVREIARDHGASWEDVEDLAAAMAQSAVGQFGYVAFSEEQEKQYVERFKELFNCDTCTEPRAPALCRLTFKLWGLTPPCDWR